MTTLPSATRVRELLTYDPETGAFQWVAPRRGRRSPTVGCPTACGYLRVHIDGRLHYLHRLAWLLVHGEWPRGVVDHINGQVGDNRIANLRDVDRSTNMQNERGARRNNTSGVFGAHKHGDKFSPRIRVQGAQVSIGRFETAEEAGEAYIKAKRQHHKGFTL